MSVLLASFKICLYKLSREEKTGHFSLLAVGVLSEMELSRCRDNHSSNIVQILFKVPRLTKTKSAKFVSDEQKGSHHHKLVFVYNCSFVQEHILAFKDLKICISTNNALPHSGIMYIYYDWCFFKTNYMYT